MVWSDDMEDRGPRIRACSLPLWAGGREARDGDSSVSSGRLSGSSGGHESCAPPHGPWRERPPQMLGPQRQPRRSNPRLEQLRDKIRAQTQWQASCASLGTSALSSASRLCKPASPAPRRKTRRTASSLPAPTRCPGFSNLHATEPRTEDVVLSGLEHKLSGFTHHQASVPRERTKRTRSSSWKREKPVQSPSTSRSAKGKDSELVGIYAWRKGQALVRLLLGTPARPRLQSKAPSRDWAPGVELGDSKRAAATQGSAVHSWLPRPTSACSDQRLSENTPSLTSQDQPATIQTAMAILQDLRQQIQAGLDLACGSRSRRKLRSAKANSQHPAGRRPQDPQSSPDMSGSFSKSPWAMTERKCSSLDKASSSCAQQSWRTLAECESCPQRAWMAQEQDPSFQRSRNPPEKLDTFSQRPWSTLGGQTCPQRVQAACEHWEIPVSRSWSSLERPRPAPRRPWSSSFVQKTGPPTKGRVAVPHPLGAKQAWSKPTQGLPRDSSGKEQDLRSSMSCPRPRLPLSQPHSSESLQDFMRQKAQARRQQALERKALATRTLELRNQRLQEVYRKQKEAVLGKAVPVVSQTNPGIVTFVPSSARSEGLEAPESLASPVLQWSKVTSGKVLGGQEAPGSFCLCLNRAWDLTETLETGTGAPLLLSTASSLGPLQLQDLPRGLCVYLDPKEADRLGPPGPLHFQYKQARLQALETMANVLKQRIDILTAKLRGAEASDTAPDWPPPALACHGALVPNRDEGAPQGWVGARAESRAPPTCFLDDGPQLWSPSWEPQSPSPRASHQSQPQGVDEGRWELEKRLRRDSGSFRSLGALTGSSRRLPARDRTSSSLGLEDMPAARGADLVMPWSTWSCGQQELGRLCAGDPPSGHLADFQQKSSSFLESLKLNQRKQEQAVALLQQQAEHEVWETQMTLEELLFKHQLNRLLEKDSAQARPGTASKLEQLQTSGESEPRTLSDPALHSARAPSPLGGDAAPSPQAPEDRGASRGHKEASAEPGKPDPAPSQLPSTRLCPPDSPTHQRKAERPRSAHPAASRPFGLFTVRMLEQNLREEELRAQHQAELLRLREMALEEKARAELAGLEHEFGCLALSTGPKAVQETLLERQQQALSRLEKEQREIQHLRDFYLSAHQDRKQLLQHQKAILTARSSATCLRQELQSQTQLPQNSSPEVKATGEEGSEPSQQPEVDLRPLTAQRPHSPTSHRPQRSPKCSKVSRPASVQLVEAPPEMASHADDHLWPPRSAWGENIPEPRSPLVEGGNHMDQGPRLPAGKSRPVTLRTVSSEPSELPRVPLLNLLLSSPLSTGRLPGPAPPMQTMEAEGSPPTARLRPQEAKEPPAGDSQTKPRITLAEESPPAPTDSPRWNLAGQSWQSQGREGSCSPQEARMAESSTSEEGAGFGLDVAGSPTGESRGVGEPQDMENWLPGEQRVEACWQEDIRVPFAWLETARLAASPAPEAPKEASAPRSGSLLPQLGVPVDLDVESASRTCSGSSEAPASSPAPSAGSASDRSCPSLQEFQTVTATLVQLSDSSLSLSGLEAEVTPDADLKQSMGFSVRDSWEQLGPPLSWGLHQEDPQPGGGPGGAGCMSWPRQEGRGAGSLGGSSMEVAVAGSLESRQSLLQADWSLAFPDAPPPRSGSELSVASNQIWDEDSRENLWEAGTGAEPAPGSSWPAGGSSHLQKSGQPQGPLPLLGPREGQESSGASESLTSGSNTGQTKQAFPEETSLGLPLQTPSTSDLDPSLSFPSETSTCGGVCLSRGEPMPPQAPSDPQEEPWSAALSLSTERKLPQTSPEPGVPLAQHTPEVPSGLDSPAASQVPGCGGSRDPLPLEEAGPPCAFGFLVGIQSPGDEELSCSSGDLTLPTHRDAHLPPTPPTPEAKSDAEEAHPCSEDFPAPPEEAMLSGGSVGSLGEDTSIATEDASEEALPEALSPGPQELGLCLGVPEKGSSLQGKLGGSGATVGSQAVGSQGSEPAICPGSPLSEGEGSAPRGLPKPSAHPLSPSHVACVAQQGLPRPLVAGDMDMLLTTQCEPQAPALGLGSWAGVAPKESLGHMGRPWEGVRGLECVECKPGSGPLLRTVTSPAPWPAVPAASLPGPEPLLASVGEEGERSPSCRAEDWPGAEDSPGREQLPGGHSSLALASGPCADLPGLERGEGAQAVDLVSTRLTRRILCDSLAVLSGLVPQGSP